MPNGLICVAGRLSTFLRNSLLRAVISGALSTEETPMAFATQPGRPHKNDKSTMQRSAILFLGLLLLWVGCVSRERPMPDGDALFTELSSAVTGITFENRLEDSHAFNVFSYRNYYDGGGVGLADLNGDGLVDVYFTANQLPNRLYLNRGDFHFEDVTEQAGVAGEHAWSTGISIADVNGDGWPDLYVSNSGDIPGDDRANELFIHQGLNDAGMPIFEEQAHQYGLADTGYSTHAAFFDYDKDGDLDCYLMNNTSRPLSSFTVRNVRNVRHEGGGDKLYRNDGAQFTDISAEAGIYGSEIAFGLGVSVGDLDGDGWMDIYVSNDFFERDYLYINNQDGTFREDLESQMRHISLSSMGADIADVNNDGLMDIYVTDMLPEEDYRLKTTTTYDSWTAYQNGIVNGFHRQFTRNMLHLNNGDDTFSEIGNIAGVAATDWSWSALVADFDLDGNKDIFVANGIYRDLTNQDFIAFFADHQAIRKWIQDNGTDMRKLIRELPSTPLSNYLFAGNGNLAFTNRAGQWGLDNPSFSNGAAYGDLDRDGDFDLVVNNVNQEAFVYRNEASTMRKHAYLQVLLEGAGQNRFAVGARVTVYSNARVQTLEQLPTRGFQSSVDPTLTFGLGTSQEVDSVVVRWPDGLVSVQTQVAPNQLLRIGQNKAFRRGGTNRELAHRLLLDITGVLDLNYTHEENAFVDFEREPLLPRLLSREGPRLAAGDLNGDGRKDFYVGGAKGMPGALFIQQPGGGFTRSSEAALARNSISEDQGAAIFDADGDGDQDLYVVSGGTEYARGAPALRDRLYLNAGSSVMELASDRAPSIATSGSCAEAADVDQDGDVDLFVGGRLEPWLYGARPRSFLLENDGDGYFRDATARLAPELATIGMVTDAAWTDVDRDGDEDLIIVGEWMPVTLFRNTSGRLAPEALEGTTGLWNRVLVGDLNGDGKDDLVLGNLGMNTRWRATPDKPLLMHVHDFDGDDRVEQIVSVNEAGKSYPTLLRNEMTSHFPFLADRFPRHEDYAGKSVADIFATTELQGAEIRSAQSLQTTVAWNQGDGMFRLEALPYEAQVSPVYAIAAYDVDTDGHMDLLLAGNFHGMRPEIGRADASYGLLLRGNAAQRFTPVPARMSGFLVTGEARDMMIVEDEAHGPLILVARNDDPMQVFSRR